jgi:hypothetical protein
MSTNAIEGAWVNAQAVAPAEQWRCGYCSQLTRSNQGYYAMTQGRAGLHGTIKLCGKLQRADVFRVGEATSGARSLGRTDREARTRR